MRRNKQGGRNRIQKENKKYDKKKVKNLPTKYINFDPKDIEERKLLVEKNKKQNKLEIEVDD